MMWRRLLNNEPKESVPALPSGSNPSKQAPFHTKHTAASAEGAEGAEQDAGDAAAAGEHPQALRSEGEHPQALRSGRITGGREAGPHEESHADAGYGDVGDVGERKDQRQGLHSRQP